METGQFAKQTLGVQKTIFENSFNAIAMAQEQTEKMFNGYMEKLPWVTAEGRESLQKTIDIAKQARNDFKKAVDDGFIKFEGIFSKRNNSRIKYPIRDHSVYERAGDFLPARFFGLQNQGRITG